MSGDLQRVKLVKWGMDDFGGLIADKLNQFEREFKELHMLLVPEVRGGGRGVEECACGV